MDCTTILPSSSTFRAMLRRVNHFRQTGGEDGKIICGSAIATWVSTWVRRITVVFINKFNVYRKTPSPPPSDILPVSSPFCAESTLFLAKWALLAGKANHQNGGQPRKRP